MLDIANMNYQELHALRTAVTERMWNDPDLKLRRRVRKVLAQYRRSGKINVL